MVELVIFFVEPPDQFKNVLKYWIVSARRVSSVLVIPQDGKQLLEDRFHTTD